MKRTIVSIDLSYRQAGIARMEYERPTPTTSQVKIISVGTVDTDPCGTKGIQKVRDEISQAQRFIIELRTAVAGADEVVVEMPLGSQSATGAKFMGYCYVAIAAVELNAEADFIYITPFDLKAWSGSKKNTKEHVKAKVAKRLGSLLTTRNNNEIDAIGLGLYRCDQLSYEATKQSGHLATEQKNVRSRSGTPGVIQETLKFLSGD